VTVFTDPVLGPTPLGSGEAVSCNETQRLFCLQSTPIEPPAFDVVTGSSESGDIVATVVLPASVDGYGRIELQRAAGLTAPSDLCSDPSATRSTSWTSFTAGSTLTFTDKGTPGQRYSYRLCVFDS